MQIISPAPLLQLNSTQLKNNNNTDDPTQQQQQQPMMIESEFTKKRSEDRLLVLPRITAPTKRLRVTLVNVVKRCSTTDGRTDGYMYKENKKRKKQKTKQMSERNEGGGTTVTTTA